MSAAMNAGAAPISDMAVWVPVISTLGGAVVGGAIGTISSVILAVRGEQRGRRELLLARYEEIYAAIAGVRTRNQRLHLWVKDRTKGGDPPEHLELAPYDRVTTLIDIYAPSLLPKLLEAMKCDDSWIEAFNIAKRAVDRAGLGLDRIKDTYHKSDVAHDSLQHECAKLARKLLGMKE